MQDINIYIQNVAQKHGIVLKQKEPLLMLHTILETFMEDLLSQQRKVLQAHVATMEEEHTKWNGETKARAERILSAALEAAHKASKQQIETETSKMLEAMRVAMMPQLKKLEHQSKVGYYLAAAHMIGAGLLAVAALSLFLTK